MKITTEREKYEAPQELQDRIASVGGWNIFGQPNFRAVWGWSRLTWIGGNWDDHDNNGCLVRRVKELRHVPKYTPFDRWHLEKWMPPSFYGSPAEWEIQTYDQEEQFPMTLGPYPSRGEYEHVFTIQNPDGTFLQLDPTVCEMVVRAVEHSRKYLPADRNKALYDREERKRKAQDADTDALLSDEEPKQHGGHLIELPRKQPAPLISLPSLDQTIHLNTGRRTI